MYKFKEESSTKFSFETDYQVTYEVIFSSLDFVFIDKNVLKDAIYELSIELITKVQKLPIKDSKIEPTITIIVKSFFENNPSSFAIFHISNIDKKVSLRKRLFTHWFNKYNDNFLEKHEKIVEDQFDIFYISLMLRVDNPLKINILDYFEDWIQQTNTIK